MSKIRIVYIEGDLGEVEGAFDESGNLLHWWSCNDAMWRDEYFDPLMEKLGIEVSRDASKKAKDALTKAVAEIWG